MKDKALLTGEHFLNGDEASAEGALAAGCTFFAGYPITPATEVAERMSRRLPQVGGMYIQMEDEIASMAAILGASWGGVKAMTSTSGPGFSLMMENIGLGMMMEAPCVIIDIMRAGPSTGLPTLVGQADVMQARWGSHGDYGVIALAPSSAQEMFDLTIEAFNLSERYRQPVFVLSDEVVGHMYEKVVIPTRNKIKLVTRRKPDVKPDEYVPFLGGVDLIPPMACAGEGYRVHVTGLTHDEMGYPHIVATTQERLVRRLVDKIRLNAHKITRTESFCLEDAEIVLVSYGCVARCAREVLETARSRGMKVGMLRLVTLWPFPSPQIRELSKRVKTFIVPEINYGQMAYEVERCVQGRSDVVQVGMMGGTMHAPKDIFGVIEEFAR